MRGLEKVMRTLLEGFSYTLNGVTGGSFTESFCSRTCRMSLLNPTPKRHWTTVHKFNDLLFQIKEQDHCWKSYLRHVHHQHRGTSKSGKECS